MRIPVVDTKGVALMPCTPAKARLLLKSGKARPKRNKLGLFYVQLCYEQKPNNQPLVVGVDPGSKFEGFSVVGTSDTVLNLMVEAPDHVKDAIEMRRTMRRARRFRKWRRPKRFDNRLVRTTRLPPSTRSRWEAKARVVKHLLTILPLTDAVVEDVQAVRTLTWVAFRSWLVKEQKKKKGQGNHPTPAPKKERLLPPPLERRGLRRRRFYERL